MTDGSVAAGSRRPIVLIVDDHPDTRELYSEALSLFGYDTVQAADGFDAWQKVVETPPDVIVTDVGLPKIDGLEFARLLKGNAATAHIPVIALTGFAQSTVAERGRDAGLVRVLVKPCAPDMLIAAVAAVCPPHGGAPSTGGFGE